MPGWDCHGLPIEWKIEEENYRAKGKAKPDFSDPAAMIAFRRECRAYADKWLERAARGVQAARRHRRLGASLCDDELSRRGARSRANHEIRRERPALSRLEAGDVERRREDGARRGGDRIRGYHERHGVCGVSGDAGGRLQGRKLDRGIDRGRVGRHLDDDALDDPRQPRDRLLVRRSPTACIASTDAPEDNWAKVGATYVLADALAESVFKAAKVEAFERISNVSPADVLAGLECAHPLAGFGGGYEFRVPLLEGDHVTDDAGTGFVHTAPGHGREDFDLWMAQRPRTRRARHRHAHPLHGRRERLLHEGRAGLRGPPRPHRQGREGRRQQGRDRGAGRGRQPRRARPAEAPVSAFLALEEAGDLSQHAAMVHRDGSTASRATARRCERTTLREHRPLDEIANHVQWVPPSGENAHHRHDRQPARLGRVAPARLGRADRRLREEGRAHAARSTRA